MELQYFGGNCLKITTKKALIVIDDNLAELGAVSATGQQDIALFTYGQPANTVKARLIIADPGEYEVSAVSIMGIACKSHGDGKKQATIFKIMVDDVRVVIVGHISSELSEAQLETIGKVDVLCVPVGGGDDTLDGNEALKVIKKIEPKIVVPTYFAAKGLKYPAPVASLEEALKAMSMEPTETVEKLKIKAGELGLGEVTKLIVLENK